MTFSPQVFLGSFLSPSSSSGSRARMWVHQKEKWREGLKVPERDFWPSWQ